MDLPIRLNPGKVAPYATMPEQTIECSVPSFGIESEAEVPVKSAMRAPAYSL